LSLERESYKKNDLHWKSCENRNYLIIRRFINNETEGVVISNMIITPTKNKENIWEYKTERPAIKDVNVKKTNGYIFSLNDRIFALGLSDQASKVRLSSLELIEKNQALHMFGLRLGVNHITKEIFAHRVYAYNIRDNIEKEEIDLISGLGKPEKFAFLRSKIDIFDEIYSKLLIGSIWENGIRSQI
jgi:hypothetical protein